MADPDRLLADAVAAGDAGAPLRAMRWASAWSVQALEQATKDGDRGDLSAIEAVALLDDALTEIAGLLRVVPPLIAAAGPGQAVVHYLREREDEIGRAASETATGRGELAELKAREDTLRRHQVELADLRVQVDELRRLEQLVDALGQLKEQEGVIAARLTTLREHVGQVEPTIERDSTELLRLTNQQMMLLAKDTRDVLERAAAAQAELSKEEGRAERERTSLQESARRHAELVAEHDERVAAMAAQAAADRMVATALAEVPGFDGQRDVLDQVRAFSDQLGHQLGELELALGAVLDERDDGHQRDRAALPWSASGAEH